MPIRMIDKTGVYATVQNQDTIYPFVSDPEARVINELKNFSKNNEKQISFLQSEIYYLNIEQKLKTPNFQEKIKLIENQFLTEV